MQATYDSGHETAIEIDCVHRLKRFRVLSPISRVNTFPLLNKQPGTNRLNVGLGSGFDLIGMQCAG